MRIYVLGALVFALAALPVAAQLPKATEVPAGAMAQSDVDFLRTADAANIDQLMLAKRAGANSKIPGVRSLAENVQKSHTKADDALRLLAGVKHVDLSHRSTERGAAEADDQVRKDVPKERLYVEGVVRDGNDLIAMYENAVTNSTDPDVRTFAKTMLPALQDNTRQASDLLKRRNWDSPNSD